MCQLQDDRLSCALAPRVCLAEWQRDNKPEKADYSKTASKIDTVLNKSAFLHQTDRSPTRFHQMSQTHQKVPRTVSANQVMRKDLSRPEILKPALANVYVRAFCWSPKKA